MTLTQLNVGMLVNYLRLYEDEIIEYIVDEEYPGEESLNEVDEFKGSLGKAVQIDINVLSYLICYLKANIDDISDSLTDGCPSIEDIQKTLDLF